jgi:BirA family biotin operon repressor/biotin-[acetyl-CoA-carboxylase] ligase
MVAVRRIVRLDITESTNLVALEAGEQGAAPGTVFVAAAQTAGRGRLNRPWLSPPGMGLYFSLLLRPNLAAEDLSKITLAAGLAICKSVEALCGIFPQIKWPNDLLLSGKKFGGILTETGALQNMSGGSPPLVVVGVGLNLFPPAAGFPPELKERATSLALHVNREVSGEMLLETGASAIENVVARLEKGDFPEILKEWMQRDASRGKSLTWVTPSGKEVTGVSLGPGADGVLRIRDRKGTIHTILSGDVNLVGKIPGKHQP